MSSDLAYDVPLPESELASSMLKGLNFLFVPNNRAKITAIRQKLSRTNGAIVNSKFRNGVTTHVLVDTKVVRRPLQILKVMGVASKKDFVGVLILDQAWLLDSVAQKKINPIEHYEIDIPDDVDSSLSPAPKRRKIASPTSPSKAQIMDDNINTLAITGENPNQETMTLLKEMAEESETRGEIFRGRAYRNAVDTLSKTTKSIRSEDEAIKLPGIGKSIAAKIQEIVETHGLKKLDRMKHSEVSKLMKLFKGIYGVGSVIAEKWIRQGNRTLKDVEAREDLTHNQILGLEYYEDWNLLIPREECTAHKQYLESITREIDPDVELIIAGSYRRGAKACGDIDFIITKPNTGTAELCAFLNKLLARIQKTGYHKCSLSFGSSSKWLGGCALTPEYLKMIGKGPEWGRCRRVDFLLVPWEERGAAFIYFTGNNEFNKKIRLRAQRRGMSLSGEGLFKKWKDKETGEEKKELVEGFSEKRIFEILGVKWREPTDRNIGQFDNIGTSMRRLDVKSKKM